MSVGGAFSRRALAPGETLVRQGEPGIDMFLVLDGVLTVEVDGEAIAEIGPGAIVGEHAARSGGTRTATLKARTPTRVAVLDPARIDSRALEQLSATHRREDKR